ncbi:MAG: Fic family protein [Candidatus Kapaibacterium sp.]
MKNFTAGKYITQDNYSSFQPEFINRIWQIDDMELLNLLSLADRNIGRLDMYSEYVPNVNLFIGMHIVKEATQSSKIEGTQTNIEEAILPKNELIQEKRDDWEEVQNYISALNKAIEELNNLPFSTRLIKSTHKVLLDNVRGMNKMPGEFRVSQNWIGGTNINNATFIPPHHSTINQLMNDLEKFAHNDTIKIPELIKAGIIHYQFETIHPFLDGNGRVGRLLITLYLVSRGIIKIPVLYLSDYFERNRIQYYDNLTRVRESNDINKWLKFFLTGIVETARNGIKTFDSILKLKQETDEKIKKLGNRASNAKKIIDYMYVQPIISAIDARNILNQSKPTVYKLLYDLMELEILEERDIVSKNKSYVLEEYLKLFK